MDNSSLASEVPDLLEFLRPSVRKLTENSLYEYKYFRELDDYLLVPVIPRKKRRRTRQNHRSDLELSTSLTWRKTIERPVCKDYVLIHSSAHRHFRGEHIAESHHYGINPFTLASKTVLNDTSQPQTIQESTTYQQVTTQDNVYLVIAGCRTEKVYKITTSGRSSKSNIPKVNVEERNNVSNLNQVDMDKKKKKPKIFEERNEMKLSGKSSPDHQRIDQSSTQKCRCRNNSPKRNDVAVSRSRLRITGRLGLTHDDKYVLRCAATLDDQPIDANFTDLAQMSPDMLFYNNLQQQQQQFTEITKCVNETCPNIRLYQRSIHVQTETTSPRVVIEVIGKDSHGTQVSLNEFGSNSKAPQALDQIIQCDCDKNIFARNYTNAKAKTDEKESSARACGLDQIIQCDCDKNIIARNYNYTNAKAKTDEKESPVVTVSVTSSKDPQERTTKNTKNIPANFSIQQKRTTSPKSVDIERVKDKQTQQTKRGNTILNSPISRPINNAKENVTAKKVPDVKTMNRTRPDETRNNNATPGTNNMKVKIDNSIKIRTKNYTGAESTRTINDASPDKTRFRNDASSNRIRCRNDASPDKTLSRNDANQDRTRFRNDASPDRTRSRNDTSPGRTRMNALSNPNRKNTITKTYSTTVEKTKNHVAYKIPAPVSARYESKLTKNASTNKTQTIGTITDHAQTKKALIDSWTRQMTSQMTQDTNRIKQGSRNHNPPSNISVNIDGANEYYDLLFYQDSMETDMTVRKRLKKRPGSGAPHTAFIMDDDDQSMENFMPPNKITVEKSASQTWAVEKDLEPIPMSSSKLHVRDSIEISHRREDRAHSHNHNIKITQTNYHFDDFSGTMKHFRGDDCSIQDPMQRDKEIRELLGVEKQRGRAALHKEATCGTGETGVIIQYVYENYNRKRYHPKPAPSAHSEEINNTILEPTDPAIKHHTIKAKKREKQQEINKRLQLLAKRTPTKFTKREYQRIRSINSNLVKTKRNPKRFKKSSRHCNCAKKMKLTPCTKHKYTQTKYLLSTTSVAVKKSCGDNPLINKGTSPAYTAVTDNSKDVPKKGSQLELFNAKTAKQLKKKMADKALSPKEIPLPKELLIMKATSNLELNYSDHKYPAPKSANNLKHKAGHNTEFSDSKNSKDAWGGGYSVLTLLKGRRKSASPNLRTSLFSLSNEPRSSHVPVLKDAKPNKSRRPFLKRLISCLVMSSSKASAENLRAVPSTPRAIESSIDSYQINTSLAAPELSSSIFDTSESFCSRHSIVPTSKTKREGFFSSVWGFMRS